MAAEVRTGAAAEILSSDIERTRIQAERQRLEARFATDEVQCYQRFAVNDCLGQARVVRRDGLADLRRQELSLNAAEALRRGGEQLQRIENKNSPQAVHDEAVRLEAALTAHRERQRVFEEKSAEKAAAAQDVPARVKEAAERVQSNAQAQADRAAKAADSAAQKKSYDGKQLAAKERQANQQKRLAEQKSTTAKPAKPLPSSPSAPSAP